MSATVPPDVYFDREAEIIPVTMGAVPRLVLADGRWFDDQRTHVTWADNFSAAAVAMTWLQVEPDNQAWTHDGDKIVRWVRSPAVLAAETHDPR